MSSIQFAFHDLFPIETKPIMILFTNFQHSPRGNVIAKNDPFEEVLVTAINLSAFHWTISEMS
ncbi:MAG: hypothetical protein ACYCSO_08355 [Cuniculiplasma sp.]